MSAAAPLPIRRYLVPVVDRSAPDGFAEIDQPLTAGQPATIALTKELSLVLTLPTGLAGSVRDLDATLVASRAAEQLLPRSDGAEEIGGTTRAPLRLVVLSGTKIVGSVPLTAGARWRVPESGGPSDGAVVELVVLDWELRVGTVLGAGDFGSKIRLAWRAVPRGTGTFVPPPIDPGIVSRLMGLPTAQSTLGSGATEAPSGYAPTTGDSGGTAELVREVQVEEQRVEGKDIFESGEAYDEIRAGR